MELTQVQLGHVLKRFPDFELSYETIAHNKVSPDYNIAMAVPIGKKAYVWFTFENDEDVCYVLDINKEKKISKVTRLDAFVDFKTQLPLGTVFYGTIVINDPVQAVQPHHFMIEDVFYYKGISLKKSLFDEKLQCFYDFMEIGYTNSLRGNPFLFTLPFIWKVDAADLPEKDGIAKIPENILSVMGYQAHHVQFRPLSCIRPYLNFMLTRKINQVVSIDRKPMKQSTHQFDTIRINMDFGKPQYRYPTIFQVTADIQFDIYHLFAFGKNARPVYYNVAYVPNCKSSMFLNGIFRKIRENKNLDYIEESDDEEEFQNMDEDRFVDINKVVLMECTFNQKFKRWTPTKVVDERSKVVHLNKLVRDY